MATKKYIIRENEVTYFSKSGPIVIKKGNRAYKKAIDLLMSDSFTEEKLRALAKKRTLKDITKGAVTQDAEGNAVLRDKKSGKTIALPKEIEGKIRQLEASGYEWRQYRRFWERCLQNPSEKSVEQLFAFIEKYSLTVTEDGCFLAYKGVAEDYLDLHSHRFDNSVGKTVVMPRRDVTYDPDTACGAGLHCGTYEYASDYAGERGRVVLVKVAPEDVVSVPRDCEFQKIRTCRYTVVSDYVEKKPIKTSVVNKKNRPIRVSATRSTEWTAEEEKALRKLCAKSPRPTWAQIGKTLARGKDACRKKWLRLSR